MASPVQPTIIKDTLDSPCERFVRRGQRSFAKWRPILIVYSKVKSQLIYRFNSRPNLNLL
jgi:hypothetical protein